MCRILCLAGLFVAVASLGRAQQAPSPASIIGEAPPKSFGQLRGGALILTPSVKLVDLGIDTNVLNLEGTAVRPPDFTATVRPELDTQLKFGGFRTRFRTFADVVYYHRHRSERSINPGGDLALEQFFGRHLLAYAQVGTGYSRARSGLEIDARARQLGARTAAGVRMRSGKLEFDGHGSYERTQYNDNARFMNVRLAETLDRTTIGAGAVVLYHATPYTAFTVGGERTATGFRFSSVRDIDLSRASLGLQFNPRAVIAGAAEFGYRRATPRDPLTPSYSGFAPRVDLSYRLRDMTSFAFAAARDLAFSYQLDRPYYVLDSYTAQVRQAIAHRFDVGAAAQYSLLEYRGFGLGAAAITEERVRALIGTLGVPLKSIRVEFYGGEWRRESGSPVYRSFRGGIRVSVGRVQLSERGAFLGGLQR